MFESLKDKLEGCFYTIFTPYLSDESIDYESLKLYLEHLYKGGARIFYAMAYNSRYSQLSDSEIMDLNEYCIKTVKSLDSENIIIVGDPIHCSTKVSTEFAIHAKDCGADLISLIVREKYFSNEQIIEHFSEIGKESNFPILVHEMPFLSGFDGSQMHWPDSLLKELVNVPEIIALKEDAKNAEVTRNALMLEPRIRVVIAGVKNSFINFREDGARAYLNGISIVDARIGQSFWQAYESGDFKKIKKIISKLEEPFFSKCASKFGWHRSNKALLEAAGFMHRRDRMPLKHLNDVEFEEVKAVYAEISNSLNEMEGLIR